MPWRYRGQLEVQPYSLLTSALDRGGLLAPHLRCPTSERALVPIGRGWVGPGAGVDGICWSENPLPPLGMESWFIHPVLTSYPSPDFYSSCIIIYGGDQKNLSIKILCPSSSSLLIRCLTVHLSLSYCHLQSVFLYQDTSSRHMCSLSCHFFQFVDWSYFVCIKLQEFSKYSCYWFTRDACWLG